MSNAARLEVNGQTKEYADGVFPDTLTSLIESLGLDAGMVVAEVNGEIVNRSGFADQALSSGDKIELVRFVGGG